MPYADPRKRQLRQQAISRARTDLADRYRDEFQFLIEQNFNQLLREHGLDRGQ